MRTLLLPTPPPHATPGTPGPGVANVVPDSVELQGTLRALRPETFARLRRRIEEVANATAAAAGCAATGWAWSLRPYPPLMNDPRLAELVAGVATRLADAATSGECDGSGSGSGSDCTHCAGNSAGGGGSSRCGPPLGGGSVRYVPLAEPTMPAEDFAVYTAVGGIRAAFTFMSIDSTGGEGSDTSTLPPALHTPRFRVEEGRLGLGAALHAANVLTALKHEAQEET
jgi:metal-dependent amidase/aminoacylase/carboxypeptidase family protein